MFDLFVRVQGFGDAEDDAGVPPLLPRVLPRLVAEAQRVVPRLQELPHANATLHAAAGGGAALSPCRW